MIRRILKGLQNKVNRFKLYQKNREVLSRNKVLAQSQSGKRCFILATGPSIKDQDLLQLRNENIFVVNNFWRHPQFKEIQPKFYVYIDPAGFQKGGRGNYWSEQFSTHAATLNTVPLTSFFSVEAKVLIETNNLFPGHSIYYLASAGFFKKNLDFNIDISQIIPKTKNVVIASIIIAVYMGFEEIYLLGCEHSFLAIPNKVYDAVDHFYETKEFDTNNPEQVKYYNPNPVTSYEETIHHAGILFQNYRLLKAKLAKEKPKVKIFNATPNSFLDVFPYIKFEDIKL